MNWLWRFLVWPYAVWCIMPMWTRVVVVLFMLAMIPAIYFDDGTGTRTLADVDLYTYTHECRCP